ncbi:hypothetical protein HDU88_005878 [Geranomyces variabilis]|nr:hypothetical protein HDU88_005878 [Geranomyces variabilis]
MAYFPPSIDSPGGKSGADLDAIISRFLAEHLSTTSFVAAGIATRESKASFVRTLLEAVSSPESQQVVVPALTALRILSREPNGCQDLFLRQGICTLLRQAQLLGGESSSEQPAPPGPYSETPVNVEALKCLCNVLLQHPPARGTVRECGSVEFIAKILKDRHTSLPADTQFLFLRLLFLVTVDDQATVARLLEPDCDLPATLVKLLHRAPTFAAPTAALVSEIMKTVYNLMAVGNVREEEGQHKGETVVTLAGTEVELAWVGKFENLLPEVIKLLLATNTPAPLAPPLSHIVHTLLNFPLAPYRAAFSENGEDIVKRLCAILTDTLSAQDPRKGASAAGTDLDQVLPPLIIVMSGIARQDTTARAVMRGLLMPDDIDRSKPLDQGSTVTARLIGFMTALVVPNVRESVCDLLYVLCDENAEKLVAYTGFGHAAGFLHSKGMMATPSGSGGGGGSSSSEAFGSSFHPNTGGPTLDPITGEHDRRGSRSEWDGMTDEEKEAEAEKLLVLFDKLNKTGVIKVQMPQFFNMTGPTRTIHLPSTGSTPELWLTETRLIDADAIYEVLSSPTKGPHPYTIENAHVFLQLMADRHATNERVTTFAVRLQGEDSTLVGVVGLRTVVLEGDGTISRAAAEGVMEISRNAVEVGYWIDGDLGGKGVGTRIAREAVRIAREELNVQVVGCCFQDNAGEFDGSTQTGSV